MAVVKAKGVYVITSDDEECKIKLIAKEGTSQQSTYLKADGEIVFLNNHTNTGYLGSGKELKGKKSITINSNLRNITPGKNVIIIDYIKPGSPEDVTIYSYDETVSTNGNVDIELEIEFK